MGWLPDRKVLAGGLAGVAAWLIAMLAARYGFPMTPEQQTGLVGLIGWAVAYMVPPSERDIVKRLNDGLVKMAQDDPTIPVTKPKP